MIPLNHDSNDQNWSQKGLRTLLSLACVIIVLAGMRAAAGFLVPVAFAGILSVLSYPIMGWLVRHKIPFSLSLGLTVLTIVGVVAGLLIAAISLLARFQGELPQYVNALQEQVNGLAGWLEKHGFEGAHRALDNLFDSKTMITYATQEDVMHYLGSALRTTFGTVASVFVALVLARDPMT